MPSDTTMPSETTMEQVWIADFGSQYTQLIARKVRECGVRSTIMTVPQVVARLQTDTPKAIILSGGPRSVQHAQEDNGALFANPETPILGICYGMQVIADYFGGTVAKGEQGEYGKATVTIARRSHALPRVSTSFQVWMSHGDHVIAVPDGFDTVLTSADGGIAGMYARKRPIVGLQFHPEVQHTEYGNQIVAHFLFSIAGLHRDWDDTHIYATCEQEIIRVTQGRRVAVLCAFSGGVDSLVAATICQRVPNIDLYCFFINNGLLRPQDERHIREIQARSRLSITVVDARDRFLSRLEQISDPERKRKIIGTTFIEVFEQQSVAFAKRRRIDFSCLLQGTIYPDVIESSSPHGAQGGSVTIKSHHNVGGLPDRMKLALLEPLRFLFKDEVRLLGTTLGLPAPWLNRHPFPGPGLAVRILEPLNPTNITQIRHADQILFEELQAFDCYDKTWQAFPVLLPVYTVGIKGDARVYEKVVCLRLVDSSDGMTACFTRLNWDFFDTVASRITNEVSGITRVVYDITSKPPATIEWE